MYDVSTCVPRTQCRGGVALYRLIIRAKYLNVLVKLSKLVNRFVFHLIDRDCSLFKKL